MGALFDTDTSCSIFSIVDGSHPDQGLVPFNEKKLTLVQWRNEVQFTYQEKLCPSLLSWKKVCNRDPWVGYDGV